MNIETERRWRLNQLPEEFLQKAIKSVPIRQRNLEHIGVRLRQIGDKYMVAQKSKIDDTELKIDTAINCGLILNELVSNCLKHAFPDGRGVVSVTLSVSTANTYKLEVKDNGIGIQDISSLESPTTFGWDLIRILVQNLRGETRIISDGGATVTITFNDVPEN